MWLYKFVINQRKPPFFFRVLNDNLEENNNIVYLLWQVHVNIFQIDNVLY
jgi:hypothetical protein